LLVYTLSPATAGNTTTNGSANTENETFFVKPGVRNCTLQAVYVVGKGAGLTAISGIVHRIIRWGTASTGGVSITPTPKDPGNQAAKCTAASAPTAGTTRLNKVIFGCGATGPGGWVQPNPDSGELQEGGAATSIDALNSSGTVSLAFEFSAEVAE
jgi:hypothetical protein